MSDYKAALEYLFARTTGVWKFGLDTTRALLAALGDPHLRYPVFHVGGTNGKGSVVATLDALLRANGLRVGRYTSPHLVDFRERIVVDGVPIAEDEVVDFVARWTPEVERIKATFFEATTCLAFDHFARREVDVAVVEVGLGGRLDSTNVVAPLVAGVTSIGIDHTEYLGDTIEKIAAEKAGIYKPGAAAVVGEPDPAVRALLASLARDAGASPVHVVFDELDIADVRLTTQGTRFSLTRPGAARRELVTPLLGAHQASNAAVALAMLDAAGGRYAAAGRSAEAALGRVRLAGRFQRWGRWIFDVAHNPAGAAVLARSLAAVRVDRPLTILLAVLKDKDWRGIMAELAPHADRFVLTAPPTAPSERAWSLDEAVGFARERGWPADADADFDRALARAAPTDGSTLVTGSFHTVGDAMARLQVHPLDG